MLPADTKPTSTPCEDCGGLVVSGIEPISPEDEPELVAAGETSVGSEWCTNLECPSNHVLPGLWRLGVNTYRCTDCGQDLTTPIGAVFAHRRTH